MVTVLQFTGNLTDRQAADAVRGRLDWKYCLGLALQDEGFDFGVLSEFRARLVAGSLELTILDLLLDRLKGLGLVSAGARQRADSTHVLGRIRSLNRLELAGESIRGALEALAAAAPDWLATVAAWLSCPARFRTLVTVLAMAANSRGDCPARSREASSPGTPSSRPGRYRPAPPAMAAAAWT
jgi:hypothetical protein